MRRISTYDRKVTDIRLDHLNAAKKDSKPYETDRVWIEHRPTKEQIIDRDLRAMLPARDLTGLIMGDPPVGRSALDKKIKAIKDANPWRTNTNASDTGTFTS